MAGNGMRTLQQVEFNKTSTEKRFADDTLAQRLAAAYAVLFQLSERPHTPARNAQEVNAEMAVMEK
jgi:hypothetical protein